MLTLLLEENDLIKLGLRAISIQFQEMMQILNNMYKHLNLAT